MKVWAFLSSFLLGACASLDDVFPIQYDWIDRPDKDAVELVYENKTMKTVCFSPEMWPNSQGKIDSSRDRLSLWVEGERYPIKEFNPGYCPGCAVRVEPGAEMKGFLFYSDFDLPRELYNAPKKLEFEPMAFYCTDDDPQPPWGE